LASLFHPAPSLFLKNRENVDTILKRKNNIFEKRPKSARKENASLFSPCYVPITGRAAHPAT